jgi:uncharacterized membrane protein YdjX (TVP38/TMEM64 family)
VTDGPGLPQQARKILLGLALLVAAAWLGRDFGHHLTALEQWVEAHGAIGMAAFVAAAVVALSVFVPETAIAIVAGVLFGVGLGSALMASATLLATAVDFALARYVLRDAVRRRIERTPRLAALDRGMAGAGFKLLALLRLAPLSPVLVSYALGATGARFPIYFAASFALLPAVFLEVYLGHAAKHVAKVTGNVGRHSPEETVLTIGGLVLSAALIAYITVLARRALRRAANDSGGDA